MTISERDLDKLNLSLEDYIEKYYSNIDLSGWDYWKETAINLVFDKSKRKDFKIRWGMRMISFDFEKMEIYLVRKELMVFEEDIRKFIAFLAGDGFFDEHAISLDDWLHKKNFTDPKRDFELELSILQALEFKGGLNYIRKQLMNLQWWRR